MLHVTGYNPSVKNKTFLQSDLGFFLVIEEVVLLSLRKESVPQESRHQPSI